MSTTADVAAGDIISTTVNDSDYGCDSAIWMMVQSDRDILTAIRIECECSLTRCDMWGTTWNFYPSSADEQTLTRLIHTDDGWTWEELAYVD